MNNKNTADEIISVPRGWLECLARYSDAYNPEDSDTKKSFKYAHISGYANSARNIIESHDRQKN